MSTSSTVAPAAATSRTRLSSLGARQSSAPLAFDPASNRNAVGGRWQNWAATQSCVPAYFHTPATLDDIRRVLAFARDRKERVRVVGYGHSPGHIALTDEHMVALGVYYSRVLHVDRERQQVKVETGISLEALNQALDEVGLALSSLGSISDQTVGGALACGTHGTNSRGPSILAHSVVELEILDAAGTVHVCNSEHNPDLFNAARISLGALGILTTVTLQCESAYDLIETTITVPFRCFVDRDQFQAMVRHPQADFVRFHWLPHTETVVYTRMQKVGGSAAAGAKERDTNKKAAALQAQPALAPYFAAKDLKDRSIGFHLLQALYYASTFGALDRILVPRIARLYQRLVYPPMSAPPSAGTSAPGSASSSVSPGGRGGGALVRRDRHDRILNFDCLFQQYVTEWAIDQRYTCEAMTAVRDYIQRAQLVVHFPIEIRFGGDLAEATTTTGGGGDGIWLSPCYARPQTWIGIIMYRPYGKDVAFRDYFEGFERIMSGFAAAPPAAAESSAATPAPLSPSTSSSASPSRPSFSGKPHWAKNVVMPLGSIPFARLYPRWQDFWRLRDQIDPAGMFENEYVRQLKETALQSTGKEGANQQPQRQQLQLLSNL